MLGWLYRMIVGNFGPHKHFWRVYETLHLFADDDDERAKSVRYVIRCAGCGEIETRRVDP